MERFLNDCYSCAFLLAGFRAQSAVGQPFGGRCCPHAVHVSISDLSGVAPMGNIGRKSHPAVMNGWMAMQKD
ncbi:hypothetical protein [Prevotella corporis]|uniref:hypothetical protein n=1 Tax=Prevotella corporis TaxID=28128 RepID=UPI0023FA0136|nr:hypothetical protein [Prevotella corporis]